MTLSILISPDGSLATMSGENDGDDMVYLLDLNADSSTWQQGWGGPMLPLIPGTGAIGERPD